MNYDEFRFQYETQHPASVPKLEYELSEHPKWLVFGVAALFITSALMSGVHTAPTAHDLIEVMKVAEQIRQAAGLATFVFVELGILISAYMLFRKFSWWSMGMLIISILIAVVANLYSVSQALQSSDVLAKSVGILFGIGAPMMAVLSGSVLVTLHQSDRKIEYRANAKYKEAQVAWDNEIHKAWKKYSLNPSSFTGYSVNSLNEPTEKENSLNGSVNSANGYTKNMNSRDIIREYLNEFPEQANIRLDDLHANIEAWAGRRIGRTSVHNVRSELKMNGNGKH